MSTDLQLRRAWLAMALATLCGCADRGAGDPARTFSSGISDSDAGTEDDKPGERSATGIASPGTDCRVEGARACWRNGSKLALICEAGKWDVDTICDDDQRCNTAEGSKQGACLPIVPECEGQIASQAFCAGDFVRLCRDLVSFKDIVCGERETCSGDPISPTCACKLGFAGTPGDCKDIDECAINGGGCDDGAPCKNTDGAYTCGGCPAGYVGGADDVCTPSLMKLIVTPGNLTPKLDPVETEYSLSVPITAMTIELNAAAPNDATIEIDGDEVKPNRTWRSSPLRPGENQIAIAVRKQDHPDRNYRITVTRGSSESSYLRFAQSDANDNFGASIAISEDTMVVGAPSEDSNAVGPFRGEDIASAAENDAAQNAGAAYVFVRNGELWELRAYLKPSNTAVGALFGTMVAISGDTIVIGARGDASSPTGDTTTFASGSAYVFTRRRNRWSQTAQLKASNAGAGDNFGAAVAIDDDTIVVGAPGEGSSLTGVNNAFDNNSAYGSGAAYVFVRADDSWPQQSYLKPDRVFAGDNFGSSVAISGDRVVIGAIGDDSGATGVNDEAQREAQSASGAAYAFLRERELWTQDAYFKPSVCRAGDSFGYSVAIAGDSVVVGAPGSSQGEGAAYVFTNEGGVWLEQGALAVPPPIVQAGPAMLSGPGDAFGASVRIVKDTILVGAYGEDSQAMGWNDKARGNDAAPNSGAAYLFARREGSWAWADYVKPLVTRPNQQFGNRIAISVDTLAIGAMNDGQNPRDMSSDQAELGPPSSGAVFVFR
jgi:trimeric autotransporter adhesin